MDLNEDHIKLNSDFYTFLKRIYSNEYKIKLDILKVILEKFSVIDEFNLEKIQDLFLVLLEDSLPKTKKESKLDEYLIISKSWTSKNDFEIFYLAIFFIYLKEEIKEDFKEVASKIEVSGLHSLSIKYDNRTVRSVYTLRAKALLICSKIMDFYNGNDKKRPFILSNLERTFDDRIKFLSKKFLEKGLDIKSMFGIIINESINQSIISKSGGGYEARIKEEILKLGVPLEKIIEFNHDETGSIEHDFIFEFNSRKFGISAKRTFRERYKQYVNLLDNKNADILLTISLGTDLTNSKAKTIRGFGVYIFISPEIYDSREDLQKMEGVFSVRDFNEKTLNSLI